jgi:hypothetical protein
MCYNSNFICFSADLFHELSKALEVLTDAAAKVRSLLIHQGRETFKFLNCLAAKECGHQ